MKKIIILFSAIILLSFTINPLQRKGGRTTLYSSCTACADGQPITFTGTGYHSGRSILAVFSTPFGYALTYYNVCTVDPNGNIFFEKTMPGPGDYDVSTFELGSNGRYTVMADLMFSVQ